MFLKLDKESEKSKKWTRIRAFIKQWSDTNDDEDIYAENLSYSKIVIEEKYLNKIKNDLHEYFINK